MREGKREREREREESDSILIPRSSRLYSLVSYVIVNTPQAGLYGV